MCTMIVNQAKIWGRGKGAKGWFTLGEVNVSYDHPFDAPLEHALNIDCVNERRVRAHGWRWSSVWSRRDSWCKRSSRR
jgi:hypothetical protein